MSVVCVFGGGKIDLTNVVLTSRETVIQVACLFGSVDLVVPDGVAIRMSAAAVFGSNESPTDPPRPGAPIVTITGAAVFGAVSAKRPKPAKRAG
jgi:hypothetical protein